MRITLAFLCSAVLLRFCLEASRAESEHKLKLFVGQDSDTIHEYKRAVGLDTYTT
jgi:hypothetical protein